MFALCYEMLFSRIILIWLYRIKRTDADKLKREYSRLVEGVYDCLEHNSDVELHVID